MCSVRRTIAFLKAESLSRTTTLNYFGRCGHSQTLVGRRRTNKEEEEEEVVIPGAEQALEKLIAEENDL